MSKDREEPRGRGLPALGQAILGDAQVTHIMQQFQQVTLDVETRLRNEGIPLDNLTEQRDTAPSFPLVDLVALSKQGAEAYEEAYKILLHWQGYLVTLLAMADNDLLAAKNGHDTVTAELRKEAYSSKRQGRLGSVEELTAWVESNPAYVENLKILQAAKQHRTMVNAYMERISEQIKAVSRHVTIRGQELEFGPERPKARYSAGTHMPLPARAAKP